ncbi:MAG: hypothetical protein AB7F79_03755 [Steroidobacteraceae bacterium]
MSGDPFQVRFHSKLGVVIYDPLGQMGLAQEQMRLFKVSSMSVTTFRRDLVNKDLGTGEPDVIQESANAVDAYRTARSNRLKPYCSGCRRHFGSVDFSVCTDCSSIKCTCGTCSCVARKRKAA